MRSNQNQINGVNRNDGLVLDCVRTLQPQRLSTGRGNYQPCTSGANPSLSLSQSAKTQPGELIARGGFDSGSIVAMDTMRESMPHQWRSTFEGKRS
jgi:hypothetical protein